MAGRDPYCLALLTNALQAAGDPWAEPALEALLSARHGDGYWDGRTTSVVGSRGQELPIETTALAALNLMNADRAGSKLDGAIRFLKLSRTPYGFGNTQSGDFPKSILIAFQLFSQ